MRALFALPGLHRVERGAEMAFIAVASELARSGDEVTLVGMGPPLPDRPYRYLQAGAISRERFERLPAMPFFRNETAWEDATFVPALLRRFRPSDYDVTVTCSFPFTSLALRRPARQRPAHVFVTQNGDWPAVANNSEFRLFDCDGLVCINPDYYERTRHRYRAALIPNGVDMTRFTPGPSERAGFGIDPDQPMVLMVSAMIASKNVDEGIRAIAAMPGVQLVVAGDGPLRDQLQALADDLLPGRYHRIQVRPAQMPALYRSADVFMHLSRDEAFGNVYAEASACGRPIVAYDLPRTRWILGTTGYFAAEVRSDALTDALRTAMDAPSSEQAARIEQAARFAWPAIARRYRVFFDEILGAPPAVSRSAADSDRIAP